MLTLKDKLIVTAQVLGITTVTIGGFTALLVYAGMPLETALPIAQLF